MCDDPFELPSGELSHQRRSSFNIAGCAGVSGGTLIDFTSCLKKGTKCWVETLPVPVFG